MDTALNSNGFFPRSLDGDLVRQRIRDLESGKVGFYSVGLYPASLAYNCAMQQEEPASLLLAAVRCAVCCARHHRPTGARSPDYLHRAAVL